MFDAAPRASSDRLISESAILDALPLTLIVFDEAGTITYATPRMANLLNPSGLVDDVDVERDVLGRNILEFVHPADAEFAAQLITFGTALDRQLLGPMRLRYLTAWGQERYSELWAENRLDHPGIRGHMVIVTEETSHHHFTEAVTQVAEQGDLRVVIDSVVNAMAGHPMEGRGLLLERASNGTISALSTTDLPSSALSTLAPLWTESVDRVHGIAHIEEHDFGPEIASAWRGLGVRGAWAVAARHDDRDLLLVCLRSRPGVASPNQILHLRQAISVFRLAFTQESQRRQLEHLAYHDALTGLFNRAFLYGEVANHSLDDAAVLFVDLDGFKAINDRHGHDVGDQLLRRVAEVIMANVRTDDTVARIGGDEFVVVCPHTTDPEAMQALADRLISEIAAIDRIGNSRLTIGASVGIVYHRRHIDFDALISEADAALYLAKAKGRGRWWMAPVE
ncbi:MAG: sensor domain-containing diguanylate cyclase [Acidimicrobiales bacterium]